jgi:hypothetical protein
LFDFVVADVDRSGVIGHIRLCSDMLGSLIIRVEIVGVVRVAKKLQDLSNMFTRLIASA